MVALALPCVFLFACAPPPADGDSGSSGTGGKSSSGSGGSSGQGGSSNAGSGGTPSSQGGSSGSGGSSSGATGGSGPSEGSGGSSSGATGGSSGGDGGSSGGNGGTGGTPATDAGGGDTPATPGGGASGCTGFTGKYCSDFENQPASGAPNGNGDFTVSGAAASVDSTKSFSGTKSIHFKPGAKTQLVFTKQFPFNEQYGRLMMFVAKTPPNASHWDIVQSNSSAGTIWSWGGMYGKFELVVDPPDDGKDSNTAIPDGKWFCVQWRFSPGMGGGSIYSVKMDGMEVDKSPVNNHWKAGAWKDLRVGWEVFGSAPIEFWIDDLAFGEQPIACPTK
jgi:hypothetical protein